MPHLSLPFCSFLTWYQWSWSNIHHLQSRKEMTLLFTHGSMVHTLGGVILIQCPSLAAKKRSDTGSHIWIYGPYSRWLIGVLEKHLKKKWQIRKHLEDEPWGYQEETVQVEDPVNIKNLKINILINIYLKDWIYKRMTRLLDCLCPHLNIEYFLNYSHEHMRQHILV